MKLNSNFKLRDLAGETIIVHQGTPDLDLTRIISFNPSARLLWEHLAGKDFTLDHAAEILETHYGIPPQQAHRDAEAWVEALRKCGILYDI